MSYIDTTFIRAPEADVTLNGLMSNAIFICTKSAAGRVINIPAATAGCFKYTFILTRPIIAQSLTITSAAQDIQAQWRQVNGTGTGGIADAGPYTSIAFTATAVGGDKIEMISDGTTWYAYGTTNAADGIALA